MERQNLTSSALEHIVVVARIAIMDTFKLYSFKYSSYDVDAVISDTLYKVSKYLCEYDESRSRSAWFYKIAARCASSYIESEYNWRYHHRGMAVKPTKVDEIVEFELADREGSRRDQPDFQIIVNEEMESVDRVIDTFGDKAALALRLYAEGYTYEEMQERLGMSYVALKTLISRYRKELRERLDSAAA
jgi:RNA polymerase sigma factor (sigma-70 family)